MTNRISSAARIARTPSLLPLARVAMIPAIAAFIAIAGTRDLHAQDRSQSRSMVMAQTGIVASENVLASQAGAAILAQGGNAIDAAVATNAMMGLVAPMNDGV
ncbi:MAG TPA: hypothetical protein VHV78_03590, partial [Gemmatimonadaceae bacterium]|nr:hypothetical protein [Gemmatimonadaceae bacterium]